ncbi:hydrolase [Amorphoplanes digitatis]|uniref:Putative hydrolase n=1 Tax=Actinoplanes digitatis TaxID=1868 RepID=A0A7W7HS54_9ACTN|nr:hydrolase [Actinoplanes digitatis]MBB4759678.1 putative hydrolase [Actinoplanes digitatis]
MNGTTLAAPVAALDLRTDAHVHTGFAAGRDSVGVVVSAADKAGLTTVTFADQVGPETAWLPAYADTIRRARLRTELSLRVGAEVEVVQPDGWLAWPADLGHLEVVSVSVSRLPLAEGLIAPRDVRAMIAAGRLTPDQVAEATVAATIKGIERASRYAPTQLARPLSLLAQVGIDDAVLTPELVDALAAACRLTGTAVEISEAWRSPAPRLVAMLREANVALLAASDARYAGEVGRWQYLRRV